MGFAPAGLVVTSAWSQPSVWSNTTPYVAGPPASVVTRSGGTYVCIQDSTGHDPVTDGGVHWVQVAAPGSSGGSPSPLTYTNLTLQNGSTAFGSGYATPSAAVDGYGVVHLRGMLTVNTVSGNTIALLPTGCIPAFKKALICLNANTDGSGVSIAAQTDGSLKIFATLTAGTPISLDGLTFAAGDA